jgi:endonuclease III
MDVNKAFGAIPVKTHVLRIAKIMTVIEAQVHVREDVRKDIQVIRVFQLPQ